MNDENMTEIPLNTYRQNSADGSVSPRPTHSNFPPGSTVYIASGQFTVARITTPRKQSTEKIVHREVAKNRVDKGVGCSPKNSKNAVGHWSDDTAESSLAEDEFRTNSNSKGKHVRFAEPFVETRKIIL